MILITNYKDFIPEPNECSLYLVLTREIVEDINFQFICEVLSNSAQDL